LLASPSSHSIQNQTSTLTLASTAPIPKQHKFVSFDQMDQTAAEGLVSPLQVHLVFRELTSSTPLYSSSQLQLISSLVNALSSFLWSLHFPF
jgi:hypothetical protein